MLNTMDLQIYNNISMMTRLKNLSTLLFFFLQVVYCGEYFTTCVEDANRECPQTDNRTEFLLNIKKGGADILSTQTYLYDFFLCEEYNFDCGYLAEPETFATIANGCSLNLTEGQLLAITQANTPLEQKIKPYLGLFGERAKCGMQIFPLNLTKEESKQFLDNKMEVLKTDIANFYDEDRDAAKTKDWDLLNINVRTAVLGKFKDNPELIRDSFLWDQLVANQFAQVSAQLKEYYRNQSDLIDLHEAYLIDSIIDECDKTQSVTFLLDQSGSIGAPGFQQSLDFMELYLNNTNDDFSLLSIHFFHGSFVEGIDFGNTYDQLFEHVKNKVYAPGATMTATGMNATIEKIKAQNFDNGLPKIMVVMTDGETAQNVTQAYNYAASESIIVLAVGIGTGIQFQTLQKIAGGNPSNVITIDSYANLPKLVQFISNYFCKQMITIKLDETIVNNHVRVPTSPCFFRIQKSQEDQLYELDVYYENDPQLHNQTAFESQIDPFPDEFTEYESEVYMVYPTNRRMLYSNNRNLQAVKNNSLPIFDVPTKIYFVYPQEEIQYSTKKKLTSNMNVTVSYIAIRGFDMRFNISLKRCYTFNCSDERITLADMFDDGDDGNDGDNGNGGDGGGDGNGGDDIPIIAPVDDNGHVILTPEEEDLSIFIYIGSVLAGIALCCILCIFCIRKVGGDDKDKEEMNKLTQNENENEEKKESQSSENDGVSFSSD